MSNDRKFHLKQFSLSHHRSTMKVGTDAMILAIWTSVDDPKKVLEVGTGSGIISLLIAARSDARLDEIEIDEASFHEAEKNFRYSPFFYRMNAIHSDFNEFTKGNSTRYDLIISNPPFFINDLRSENEQKKSARHADSLTYDQLCTGSSGLLAAKGTLCVVLPYNESKLFLKKALNKKLHLQKQLIIFPRRGDPPNRINLQLGFRKPDVTKTEKFIIREENGSFSEQYVQFFKDYYLGLK